MYSLWQNRQPFSQLNKEKTPPVGGGVNVFALFGCTAMVFVLVGTFARISTDSGVLAAPGRADAADDASGVLCAQAQRAAVGDDVVILTHVKTPP